jgi:homoserine O-succinyltransferase
VPAHYFVGDDPKEDIIVNWRSVAHLFYANWLNLVYQKTPYVLVTE